MNKPSILVVEDDVPVRCLITTTLKTHGYKYLTASNGETAIMMTTSHNPDIMLLDLGLPDIDGIEVIRSVRTWSNLPIIVLSARSEDSDKIEALDNGADDYLTKPFSVDELLARLRVTQRRLNLLASDGINSPVFVNGPLKIDFSAGCVWLSENELHLTPIEYKLLCVLAHNVGKVLTHTSLTQKVWGSTQENDIASLRVYMASLRKKLERCPDAPHLIQTHVGVGYRMLRVENDEADVNAVVHLIEVGGAGVVVHVQLDLVDAGQRMQHRHILRCLLQQRFVQLVAAFQAQVFFLVEKALLLDTGHIQHIQMRQLGFKVSRLLIDLMGRLQRFSLHILRQAQILRRDEHEPVALKLAQRSGQGVDRPAELEVAAEADGQMIQPPLALADGHQVDHGLGGVRVAAIACIDDRHARIQGRPQRRTLFGVAHGNDVGIVAHDAGGVLHRLALAGTGQLCPCKAQRLAAQPQHGRFKRKAGAGGRLIEQGGQNAPIAQVGIGCRVGLHPVGKIQKGQLLFQRKAVGLNKVSHSHAPFSTNFSRSAPVETNWISWPSCFSRNST